MRILITGGTGMVGSAFSRIETHHELNLVGSKDYDLRIPKHAEAMMFNYLPDAVIHLAAKVGGVSSNLNNMSDYFSDNMKINMNVLNEAKNLSVKKVVSLLSTCVYPDKAVYPLTEEQIHNGEPHYTNFGYAYAKRMLDVQSRAIREQYGLNYITAIPNNLYGPHDNFDLENSHVIPALIRKLYMAKPGNPAELWGTGDPLREFTCSDDIAKILLLLVDNYDDPSPINIGSTEQISIKKLAYIISKKLSSTNYISNYIKWDTTKPEGQFRKPSSNLKFRKLFPDFEYTDLDEGINQTIEWFLSNYPNIRGIK